MKWIPVKQFTLTTTQSKSACADTLLSCHNLISARGQAGIRCVRNSVPGILFGPVAHVQVQPAEQAAGEGSNLSVQLLPPMWTWIVSLAAATVVLLDLFETRFDTILLHLGVGFVGCWTLMMVGFWQEQGSTETTIRRLANRSRAG